MTLMTSWPRSARLWCLGVFVSAAMGFLATFVVAAGPSAAADVLTNDGVIKMVKAGLSESVVIQKIRTSEKKFDTSADALVNLKSAGVPDSVIEAMLAPGAATGTAAAPSPAPASVVAATSAEPRISHMAGGAEKPLKSILGPLQSKLEPFAGTRTEVVLVAPRAEYRIADREPVFYSPQTVHQWVLARLKPGKQDRNLPINKNQGFWIGYTGATFQHGVDPKYVIKLTSEPGPNRGVQLKLTEPLKPGEYGFIAVTRGQPNLVEVFDFAVE